MDDACAAGARHARAWHNLVCVVSQPESNDSLSILRRYACPELVELLRANGWKQARSSLLGYGTHQVAQ
jgi:hypothetical protein